MNNIPLFLSQVANKMRQRYRSQADVDEHVTYINKIKKLSLGVRLRGFLNTLPKS